MPGTAANNNSRTGQTARPSAKYRAAQNPIEVPVLLRFPIIEPVAGPASPVLPAVTQVQIGSSNLSAVEPTPPRVSQIPDVTPVASGAGQPVAEQANPTTQLSTKTEINRSWWEHWSSGIVLFVLMLALFIAAIIAFNDSRNSPSNSLADKPSNQSNPKPNDSGSLASLEFPTISLGEPVASESSDKPSSSNTSQSASVARPLSQVSVRTVVEPTAEPNEAGQTESEDNEDRAEGDVRLGLPTPIKDGSASNSTQSATLSQNSLILSNATAHESTNSSKGTKDAAQTAVDADQESLISAVPAPSMLTLGDASATSPTLNHNVNGSVPQTAAEVPNSSTTGETSSSSAALPSENGNESEKVVSSTTTPEFETEQLVKLWLEFSERRSSDGTLTSANRYLSTTSTPAQTSTPSQIVNASPSNSTFTNSPTANSAVTAFVQPSINTSMSSVPNSPTVTPFQPVQPAPGGASVPAMTAGFRNQPTYPTPTPYQSSPYQTAPNQIQPSPSQVVPQQPTTLQFLPTQQMPSATNSPPSVSNNLVSPSGMLPSQTVYPQTNGTMATIPYPGTWQAPQSNAGTNVSTTPLGLIGSQGPSQPR